MHLGLIKNEKCMLSILRAICLSLKRDFGGHTQKYFTKNAESHYKHIINLFIEWADK